MGEMSSTENRQIILARRPSGAPTGEEFELHTVPTPKPDTGEVLVRALYLSVDPYMRGRMRDARSYATPFAVNQPMEGGVVGEVVESKATDLAVGDIVAGTLPWQDYSVAKASDVRRVDPKLTPVSTALGVLGMTGLTAYIGLMDIGKPRSGETVVVSGAAGAVGTVVGQIAKIHGSRVVGIAGSDRKNDYLTNKLGFDATINYKSTPHLRKAVASACPDGVDIYFDNVGGEISDAVMANLSRHARIIICGQISQYNLERPEFGPRPQLWILGNSALMQGFLVFEHADRFDEVRAQLGQWVTEKKLISTETIISGLEKAPKAFLGLFSGENLGKQIVKVAEPTQKSE